MKLARTYKERPRSRRRSGAFRKGRRLGVASHLPPLQKPPGKRRTCDEGSGELVLSAGTMAKVNPPARQRLGVGGFRFSTKYQDDESDLLYYGYQYCNPSTGRWISRDPMKEGKGRNPYGFVANDSVAHTDRVGLYDTRDHPAFTEQSFREMCLDLLTPLGLPCMIKLQRYVARWSFLQDVYHSGDNRRHFVRDLIPNEGEADRERNRISALIGYREYLAVEQAEFYQDLNPQPILWHKRKPRCKEALQALGYLAHSWQDFYGHGIHPTTGWKTRGLFVDSPDMQLDTVPSSWIFGGGGEHPGLGMEPFFDDSERFVRHYLTIRYVSLRFERLLSDWLDKCRCSCDEIPY